MPGFFLLLWCFCHDASVTLLQFGYQVPLRNPNIKIVVTRVVLPGGGEPVGGRSFGLWGYLLEGIVGTQPISPFCFLNI